MDANKKNTGKEEATTKKEQNAFVQNIDAFCKVFSISFKFLFGDDSNDLISKEMKSILANEEDKKKFNKAINSMGSKKEQTVDLHNKTITLVAQ